MDELDDRSRRALLGMGVVTAGAVLTQSAQGKRKQTRPLASVVIHITGIAAVAGALNLSFDLFFLDLRFDPPQSSAQTGSTAPVVGSPAEMQDKLADFARFGANALLGVPKERVAVWII
jgi:hypothetical protein